MDKKMPGINLLSTRAANSKAFHVTSWHTYLFLNPERKIIGFRLPTPSEGPLLEYIIYKGIGGSYAGDAFESVLIPKKDEPHAYDHTEEFKKWLKEINWKKEYIDIIFCKLLRLKRYHSRSSRYTVAITSLKLHKRF